MLQFHSIQKMLEVNKVRLSLTSDAAKWLASQGFDPSLGARPVKRVLQRLVVNELSKEILAGKLAAGAQIEVALAATDDKLEFRQV